MHDPIQIRKKLGELVRTLREQRGWSQEASVVTAKRPTSLGLGDSCHVSGVAGDSGRCFIVMGASEKMITPSPCSKR